jgi:arsenical pump membrane protein
MKALTQTVLHALHAALAASVPLVCFLTAVIWLADVADRCGLAGRIAHLLAGAARGSAARLYALVCLACALLTATLSLDGAVVVMVPVIRALARRGAPARPLLLATIGVANAFSIAVVQGNPTNLVVMTGLHMNAAAFDATMLGPGAAAAAICAAVVAVCERRRLGGRIGPGDRPELGRGAAIAAAALAAAGAGEGAAPALGFAPWWPVCGVAAVAAAALPVLGVRPPLPSVPWRIGLLVTGLATLLGTAAGTAGLSALRLPAGSVWALLAVTAAAAAIAATVNNLPAAVAAGALLHSGPAALAVLAGVSIGALAGPRGSVATLLVRELAGRRWSAAVDDGYMRLWPATAAVAAAAATTLIWFTAVPPG